MRCSSGLDEEPWRPPTPPGRWGAQRRRPRAGADAGSRVPHHQLGDAGLRSRTGTVGMGGNGQFTRLSVLDSLAEEHERPWGRKLCEDYELGLNILEQGLRTHYVREAHVSQEALPFTRRLITQRTRWAQGNMECASALPGLRRSGHLSAAGLVEIHYFMLQPLTMMLNLVLVPLLLALGLVQDPGGFWSAATLLTLVLAGLFFLVLPYAVWGLVYRSVSGGEVSLLGAAGLGLCNLVYVYLTYVYYARAAWRSLTGRTGWAKTRRNADGRTLAAVPVTAALEALPLMRLEEFEELTAELEGRSDLGIDFVAGWAVMWPTRSSRLERAIAAEQPAAIRDAIGSLRVSSAMVGAARLEQAATDLEQSLAGDDLEVCRAQLPLVIAIGRETVDLLRKEVSVRRSCSRPPARRPGGHGGTNGHGAATLRRAAARHRAPGQRGVPSAGRLTISVSCARSCRGRNGLVRYSSAPASRPSWTSASWERALSITIWPLICDRACRTTSYPRCRAGPRPPAADRAPAPSASSPSVPVAAAATV